MGARRSRKRCRQARSPVLDCSRPDVQRRRGAHGEEGLTDECVLNEVGTEESSPDRGVCRRRRGPGRSGLAARGTGHGRRMDNGRVAGADRECIIISSHGAGGDGRVGGVPSTWGWRKRGGAGSGGCARRTGVVGGRSARMDQIGWINAGGVLGSACEHNGKLEHAADDVRPAGSKDPSRQSRQASN